MGPLIADDVGLGKTIEAGLVMRELMLRHWARPMRLLREVLPSVPRYPRAFDLLVVDEVHGCAPSGRGRYAVDSLRTTAIRALAPHCEHRLFLSATPHNGYLESFTAPAEDQLATVMVRRLKSTLPPKWDGTPRFPRNNLDYLEVGYSEPERRARAAEPLRGQSSVLGR
ncbi:MAG: hypothetical protein ACRDTE_01800 [Pseudonocardiaceae bacterium]